ncbi:hypothetical protein B0H11DRAFT_1907608 [Mycena galericulata]|nr:hypothetical protein B0H11DRAFT_1907608 [Mycena galericulata]
MSSWRYGRRFAAPQRTGNLNNVGMPGFTIKSTRRWGVPAGGQNPRKKRPLRSVKMRSNARKECGAHGELHAHRGRLREELRRRCAAPPPGYCTHESLRWQCTDFSLLLPAAESEIRTSTDLENRFAGTRYIVSASMGDKKWEWRGGGGISAGFSRDKGELDVFKGKKCILGVFGGTRDLLKPVPHNGILNPVPHHGTDHPEHYNAGFSRDK